MQGLYEFCVTRCRTAILAVVFHGLEARATKSCAVPDAGLALGAADGRSCAVASFIHVSNSTFQADGAGSGGIATFNNLSINKAGAEVLFYENVAPMNREDS
jgi:hypothetical protein